MTDVVKVAQDVLLKIGTFARDTFIAVGGPNWYEKMLMGAVMVIVGLLIIIAVVTVYLAFKDRT